MRMFANLNGMIHLLNHLCWYIICKAITKKLHVLCTKYKIHIITFYYVIAVLSYQKKIMLITSGVGFLHLFSSTGFLKNLQEDILSVIVTTATTSTS